MFWTDVHYWLPTVWHNRDLSVVWDHRVIELNGCSKRAWGSPPWLTPGRIASAPHTLCNGGWEASYDSYQLFYPLTLYPSSVSCLETDKCVDMAMHANVAFHKPKCTNGSPTSLLGKMNAHQCIIGLYHIFTYCKKDCHIKHSSTNFHNPTETR